MTTPKDALSSAQASRIVVATRDRRVFTSIGSSTPNRDSRVAQLTRCAEKADRILAEANAVPAYLGDNPKRRAVVVAANWRAHNAWIRRQSALATRDAILGLAS
jgi:hypothetical protein